MRSPVTAFVTAASFLLASCGGGGNGGGGGGGTNPGPAPTTPAAVYAVPAQEALTTADVENILAQAVEEAQARAKPAVISVVDRVGNVLAVFEMAGAPTTLTIKSPPSRTVAPGDIEGLSIANAVAAGAIAKAITGAYLSSGGNAFTSRTASQIVQQHFPPAPNAVGLESGPLFGVQFSQLPCSDLSARFNGNASANSFIGPKRSPLGLSADPGGMPLYKNGVLVGGIGVMSDGLYSYDGDITDFDSDTDEFIAIAGQSGFEPTEAIRAGRITVDGTSLRYADATAAGLARQPSAARPFGALNISTVGRLVAVNGYGGGTIIAGRAYGAEASGVRASTLTERNGSTTIGNPNAFVLTDGLGNNRFPIRGGTDIGAVAQPLSVAEVKAVLEEAFTIMSRARAQIRRPLDSRAEVSIAIVDTRGQSLGLVRSPDAPVFGIDVALQKARTANFFSGSFAAADLRSNPSQDVRDFVSRSQIFLNDPGALAGDTAFPARAVGLLARPYFPDGQIGTANGPLSRPIDAWSPFNTGLQTALILTNIAEHVSFVLGQRATDTPQRCTFNQDAAPGQNRLQNGIQIFPGGVPIYRGTALVGAIGVSGDGIDQDDMIAFLGTHLGGLRVGGVGNADPAIRSDRIQVPVNGNPVRLRYVGCPFAPFLDTPDQNACQGK